MKMRYFLILYILLFFGFPILHAHDKERKFNFRMEVSDENDVALPYASIEITATDGKKSYNMTDMEGVCNMFMKAAEYNITITYSGFHKDERKVALNDDQKIKVKLKTKPFSVEDVVVTAQESKGITSSSIINRKAMEHLQPSSFADLLELLPGGMSKTPQMGKGNFIQMRQAETSSKDYDISSLGTSFVIDGIPIATSANLQSIRSGVTANEDRDITSRGVDMRTISTDNIESVEIIRGIPSVQYGDLTNGVIKINRKEGITPLNARFKADGLSKMVSVGKGVKIGEETIVNFSTDYLNSKVDPRDRYENYKRFTLSAKLLTKKTFTTSRLDIRSSFDYGGSFDNKKSDPDIDEENDKFSSSYNRFAIGNTIKYTLDEGILQWLELKTSFSIQFDKLKQTRDIYLNTPSFIPNSTTEGEHDGLFLPNTYTSNLTIDGKPLNGYIALNGRLAIKNNNINFGGEYTIDKNLGEGQLYDATRPPAKSMRGRPRAYNEIPALQKLSLYVEDDYTLNIHRHILRAVAGVRASSMVGMDDKYRINGRLYAEPRVNMSWKFPQMTLWGEKLHIDFGGGYGIHIKTPTLDHLYPEKNYYDIESMNYFHNNPDYRRLYLTTYIIDPTNYNLLSSRNDKWEVRTNLSFANNHFSVTYFQERCDDAFRDVADYLSMNYKKYDTSGIDPDMIVSKPEPSDLPSTNETLLTTYSKTGNGSSIRKKGIEFQFASARIPVINTRITINGAWFKTTYSNSCDMIYSSSVILNGKPIPYLGIYDLKDGSTREQFNTNIMFDTYIPKLNLTFSTSIQNMWFTAYQTLPKNRTPYAYIDTKGVIHRYTEQHKSDPVLQWLMLKESSVTKSRVPIASIVNFKANKQFGKYFNISLFVNGLLDYTPDYTVNNNLIRRTVSPYFGMELNIKI